MCMFCENITNYDNDFVWLVRSTYAEDDICEYINDKYCENCEECNMKFKLKGYDIDDTVYIKVYGINTDRK